MALVVYEAPPRARKYRAPPNIPGKKTIERRAIRKLLAVMKLPIEDWNVSSQVGAARTLLDYATSDPVAEAFAMLHGGDEQALAWMEAKADALRAKLAERNGGANSTDGATVESEPVRR